MPTSEPLTVGFDPFDALGLKPAIYTEKEINEAYRKTARIVHPDRHAKPNGRFPEVWHAKEARTFLISRIDKKPNEESIKDIAKQFNSYPRTFLDGKFLDFRLTDHPQFRQCDICSSALPCGQIERHLYDEHQRKYCQYCEKSFESGKLRGHTCKPKQKIYQDRESHSKPEELRGHTVIFKTCQYCQQPMRDAEFANHLSRVHQLLICKTCHEHVDAQYEKQHRYFHHCPFCRIRLPKCSLQKHAEEAHSIEPCRECPVAKSMESHKKLFSHIDKEHKMQACMFCSLVIEFRSLKKHLETKHELVTCGGCDVSKETFTEHVSKAHGGTIDCRLCNTIVMGEMRLPHLREIHGFLDCLDCGRLGYSPEHILKGHKWAYCNTCNIERREPLAVHQVTEHGWNICRNCDVVFATVEELLSHEEAHSFIICPDCPRSKRVLIENYRQHLRDAHQKKDCVLCEGEEAPEPMATSDLRQHIEDNHPLTQPCPKCNEPQTVDGLPLHLQERHLWMMCMPCKIVFESNHELKAHVASEHTQCKNCDECPPRSLMSEHLINEHNFMLQPPYPSSPRQRQSVVQPQDDLDDSGDLEKINAQLKGLQEAVSGKCPFTKCKKRLYRNLARHLRETHDFQLTTFRGKRMSCKGDPTKEHSVSHSYKCLGCKAWRAKNPGKRKRGTG